MRFTFTNWVVAGAAVVLSSCAGSYSTIRPQRITNYQSVGRADAPVEFSYQYSALLTNGANKKYVKKARKRGYQVVAVRVKNNTGSELNFSRDLELYFGDKPTMPVPALQAANDLKQGVPIYLLYLLLNFSIGGTYNPQTGQTTGATFIPTGPFIAAGNMIGAGSANANMRKEFVSYDLANKVLRPGETVYGILSLREMNVAPLRLELRPGTVAAPASAPATPATPAAAPTTPAAPAQTAPASGGQ